MKTVLVLAGGPDLEREVSLASAAAVAGGLEKSKRFHVNHQIVDALRLDELRDLQGDVIFPVLHGSFGEGGPMQDLLVADGRPFVGSGPAAARLAMDKMATKLVAANMGIPTPGACVVNPRDSMCPLALPVVAKPVHEGSSVGLFVCKNESDWQATIKAIAKQALGAESRNFMVESCINGRELTVGIVGAQTLPIIEIVPTSGVYDYDAKYERDDTSYVIEPNISAGVKEQITSWSLKLARELGVKHVARVDFMLDDLNQPWLLEINTMPGFTDHSLLPKAALAMGKPMPDLCAQLVDLALGEHLEVQVVTDHLQEHA